MLSGESNAGSWRTHTPLLTTASTEQPTEQWVQIVCLICGAAAAPGWGSAAAAGSITLSGRWRATAPMPAATPAPTRNERRLSVAPAARCKPSGRRFDDMPGAAPCPAVLTSDMVVFLGRLPVGCGPVIGQDVRCL